MHTTRPPDEELGETPREIGFQLDIFVFEDNGKTTCMDCRGGLFEYLDREY